jgi:transposase
VKLVPPVYVKPFVKRQKNDAADAEAIAEATSRPTMRFVEVKSVAQQSLGMLFRIRDLLVRQRTQTINALRGHLAEFGVVAPQGAARVDRLGEAVAAPGTDLPEAVRELARLLIDQIASLSEKMAALERSIRRSAPQDQQVARLMTVPGVGAICATAVQAFSPPMTSFRSGRGFAAWVGLTPKQRSTGGKPRLGKTAKMGQRDIRRLLIIGASAVVSWAARKGPPEGSWLARMMARKPRMLVVVALANKMARIIWALTMREEDYRAPVVAA